MINNNYTSGILEDWQQEQLEIKLLAFENSPLQSCISTTAKEIMAFLAIEGPGLTKNI